MRPNAVILTIAAAVFIAFVTLKQCIPPALDSLDGYFIPLVGGFGIHQKWREAEAEIHTYIGRSDLNFYEMSEERMPTTAPANAATETSPVEDVRDVAVIGSIIVGSAEGGKKFFIFDASLPHSFPPNPIAQTYSNRASWVDAMRAFGIREIPELHNRIRLAKGVPDRVLHPEDYRRFRGMLGWADYAWSTNIFSLSLLAMFLFGLLSREPRLVLVSIVLGLMVNVVCEILLGDGIGAFPGLFGFPMLFWIIGSLGGIARRWGQRYFVKA